MFSLKSIRVVAIVLAFSGSLFALQAKADPVVTYTWTTTSQGSPHLGQPSSATFDASLSAVLSGKITPNDISNIQFFYPGLTFNNSAVSTLGFDFGAYVNPVTGALVFHDDQQGLALIAFAGASINDATTYLSILFDNPVSGAVKDQFNALNNGSSDAGFRNAGFWTATLPVGNSVPEPGSLALLGLGILGIAAIRRRKQ